MANGEKRLEVELNLVAPKIDWHGLQRWEAEVVAILGIDLSTEDWTVDGCPGCGVALVFVTCTGDAPDEVHCPVCATRLSADDDDGGVLRRVAPVPKTKGD